MNWSIVHIINGNIGTKTNFNGLFSIAVSNGNSLTISHIGFHSLTIVISDSSVQNKKIYLYRDTIDLQMVKIYPTKTYEDFKESIINMPFEYDVQVFNAKNNINLCLYQARSGVQLEWTVEDMAKYSLKQFSYNVMYPGQISPERMITSSQMIGGIFSIFSKKKNDEEFIERFSSNQSQFYYLKKINCNKY